MNEPLEVKPPTPPTIDDLIKELAQARIDEKESKEARDLRLKELQEDEVYKFQAGKYEAAKKLVPELETRIKNMARGTYIHSGNRKIHTGILEKEFKVFKVTDPAALLAWCILNFPLALSFAQDQYDRIRALVIEHMPAALIVNEKMIEDYVKNNKNVVVPGTELGTDVQFQIASKL